MDRLHLAEVEANLWHTTRNLFLYSEQERVPTVYEQDAKEAKRGLAVFDGALKDKTWLVEDRSPSPTSSSATRWFGHTSKG